MFKVILTSKETHISHILGYYETTADAEKDMKSIGAEDYLYVISYISDDAAKKEQEDAMNNFLHSTF